MADLLSSSPRRFRRLLLRAGGVLGLVALAACDPVTTQAPATIDATEPVEVALLVPSGSDEAGDEVLARSLENAARLAIADLGAAVTIDLRVYQTEGSPAVAAEVAAQAVNEGAKIILGPVFAQSANAVGATVRPANINVLSFSNNTDIAGGNVFVLGNTFQNTADRMVKFAAGQGRTTIVVAHAQNTVGQVGANAVALAAANSGLTLAGRNSYPLSQEDVIAAVDTISATVQSTGATALFLTSDPFGELPLLAELLPENGVNPEETKFIGLTRWDIPSSTLELAGTQGGWFALPDPGLASLFENRFTTAFGTAPHPIAGLAYDGMAAIGALIAQGGADALTVPSLIQPDGFAGVNGVFRFRSDGTIERALAVAEVRENQVVVIDPAPRSFGASGF